MGGTKSKATYNAIVDSLTEVIINYTNECLVTATQEQKVDAVNTGFQFWGGLEIGQNLTFSVNCALKSENIIKLQDQIINKLTQELTNTDESIFPSLTSTKVDMEVNIRNSIKAVVKSDFLNRYITENRQKSTITASNYGLQLFWNIKVDQSQAVFVNATLDAIQSSDIFRDMKNDVEQNGDNLNTDGLSKLLNTFTSFWWVFAIIFIIVSGIVMLGFAVIFFIYMNYGGSSSNTSQSGTSVQYEPPQNLYPSITT